MTLTQPDMFKAPPLPAFAWQSETSRQSAIAKYDKKDSHSQREMIFKWIASRGSVGATREDIQIRFDLSGDSVRPRVWELLGNNGYPVRIMVSGAKRKTAYGNKAEVLIKDTTIINKESNEGS